jgi:hypothetical protein
MTTQGYFHLHAPQPDTVALVRKRCPTCERRRYFVMMHTPWYGVSGTCLHCGDSWEDGERLERPFVPGWRNRAIRDARDRYRRHRDRLAKGDAA